MCHNEQGKGQPADRLTGGIGSLATPQPIKTVANEPMPEAVGRLTFAVLVVAHLAFLGVDRLAFLRRALPDRTLATSR